jgi:hypothetical protein
MVDRALREDKRHDFMVVTPEHRLHRWLQPARKLTGTLIQNGYGLWRDVEGGCCCHDRIEVRWLAVMTDENKGPDRVTFSRGYGVCIMGIDGTWRRDCLLNAISDTEAVLTVEGSIQGLNLKEFFLLLSSTGLAYRRCELVRVNGTSMEIQFLKGKGRKKKAGGRSNQDRPIRA